MTTDEALRERTVVALERIAALLDEWVGMQRAQHAAFTAAQEPIPCPHPPEEREDRGSTMGTEKWRCKLCGFEHEVRRRPER